MVNDPDNDALTYTLSGGDSSYLSINSSGVLTFNAAPDFETKSSYDNVRVNVSDSINSIYQDLTISINNLNDNDPVINSGSQWNPNENQTAAGTISATDADGDTLTYSISGTDASLFVVDSSSGAVTFNTAPDYETRSSYSITTSVSDGTNSHDVNVAINVNNLNDNVPVFTSPTTFNINENLTSVGTISATDADGDTIEYRFVGANNDNSSFTINSSTGALAFAAAPSYETKTSYNVLVNAYDGGGFTPNSNITVNVSDVDEVILVNDIFTTDEDDYVQELFLSNDTIVEGADNLVNKISVTNPNNGASSIIQTPSSIAANGGITIRYTPNNNFNGSDSFTYTVSSLGETETATINVTVNSVNDAPEVSGSGPYTANENQTSVGTYAASDVDGDALTYSISGTDASSFNINSSGVISFVSAPDYEVKNSYSITLAVTDGTVSVQNSTSVSVQDVQEALPVFTSPSSFNVDENTTAVGTVVATDAEGQAITYRINFDSDNAFTIGSSSGVLSFVSPPDFEAQSSYSVVVTAVDSLGGETNQTITVNVQNTNELTEVGSINGSNVNSYFGDYGTLDISANGDVVAIGERYQAGRVSIYRYNSGWNLLGAIDGEEYDSSNPVTGSDNAMYPALSGDGLRIAIGASRNDGANNSIANSGHVRVYEYRDDSSWVQLGSDIDGTGANDAFGSKIDLSEDGNNLIVFAPYDDDNGNESGSVFVYEYTNGSWSQKGSTITGISAGDAGDNSGSVSINKDGTKILVAMSAGQGYVRVYEWANNNWSQIGSTISGSNSDSKLGQNAKLSADGNSFIVAAPYDNSGAGYVEVYSYSNSNWVKKGTTFSGSAGDYLGGAWGSGIDISHDGSRIAFGTYNNDGSWKFYEYVSNAWSQVGETLIPDSGQYINGMQIDVEMTRVIYSDHRYNSNRGRVIISDLELTSGTNAPSIASAAFNKTEESGSSSDTVSASDSDGDSLTYFIGGTDADDISINSSTGVLSFNNAFIDYENPEDANTDNVYDIRVYVTDGILWATKEIAITVTNQTGLGSFGSDIVGATTYQGSYMRVALSDDGKRLLIGYPFDSSTGTRRGMVKVFENTSGNTWTQIGSTLVGTSDDQRFGSAIDISGDGNRIIIGSRADTIGTTNTVHLYRWVNNNWSRIVENYLAAPSGTYSQWGHDVAIDYDGDRVAITAKSANTDWQNDNAGAVRVYTIDGDLVNVTDLVALYGGSNRQWMEGSLNGYQDNANARFASVDINNNGDVVVVGITTSAVAAGSGGYRVFSLNGTTWTHRTDVSNQKYHTFGQYGRAAGSLARIAGNAVASTMANSKIVVNAPLDPNPTYSGDDYGVKIDQWNENYNNTLDWENLSGIGHNGGGNRLGERVAISDDGSIVIYSEPQNDDNGTNRGQVKLLTGNTSYGLQSQSTINGQSNSEKCGSDIALSGNGDIIAIACEGYNGSGNAIGRVRIFKNL